MKLMSKCRMRRFLENETLLKQLLAVVGEKKEKNVFLTFAEKKLVYLLKYFN